MPPTCMLTDDQIAAVLTYVRREWGNTASAVDVATVKEIRGLTVSHTRPWTEAELARVAGRAGAGPGPYLKRGGGVVVIHDGMCSDDPEWFAGIVGGAKQHG
jgi:hypothetical protein